MTAATFGVADPSARLVVEPAGETLGRCDCCGRTSHTLLGYVHEAGGPTLAAYFIRWTEGHVDEFGADLDLVVGAWGEGASPANRATVSLFGRRVEDGAPSLTLVDARPEPTLAEHALKRDEVVGTPRADHIFRITDAIYAQDERTP